MAASGLICTSAGCLRHRSPFSLLVEPLRDYRRRRAVYRRFQADLSGLSNRQVADLGLYQSVIAATVIEAAWGKPARTREMRLAEGARFLDQRYSCAAGARRYRLYVPSTADAGLQGLIVMLHGCTQDPEDFALGTGMNALAEEQRLLVVYPAQSRGANLLSAWNWFRPGNQRRDAGEPAIIAGLTESLRDAFAIPADRVFVAGLSAGGAMAAIMGKTYPELYEAIGVHSGLAHGSANGARSALAAMRGDVDIAPPSASDPAGEPESGPRMIVFHGSADTTVHPSNADRLITGQGGSEAKTLRSEATDETRGHSRLVVEREDGSHEIECWMIEGAEHAWSGGHPDGSYTDPRGPDASTAMVRFFLDGTSDAAAV